MGVFDFMQSNLPAGFGSTSNSPAVEPGLEVIEAAPAASAAPAATGSSGAAKVTTDVDMDIERPAPYTPIDLSGITYDPATPDTEKADESLNTVDEMIEGLRDKNQSWLEGKVSGDTADQLRAQSGLNARMGGAGTGSQMSRNLQARDFGVTSMQIQEQGMAREGQLTELQRGVAGMREQRTQFMANLSEQQSQFSTNLDQTKAQLGEQSRQFGVSFGDQQFRTLLAQKELILKQEAFNADMNMNIIELIANSTVAMTGQQAALAADDIDDSGITSSFNNLQAQLQRLIEGNS